MRIHHIGYLVKNLKKSMIRFKELGYKTNSEIVFDEYRGIRILFMEKDGYTIELVEPTSDDSVVSDMAKKLKNSPYHICYESDDFMTDIEDLSSNGYHQIDEPHEAPALEGRRVSFLMGVNMGLIEILEK